MSRKSEELVIRLGERAEARAAILAHCGAAVRGTAGTVKGEILCPVCQFGALRYRVDAQLHVWGKCSTRGCVDWKE